ncbi:RNase A-like domain-containing protein [Streptacidiphilus sp. EB129]|uniref:RNase A-like domain-containing protein n=1 Tax=Streptacidiphilus sp. EB129 TaxID=3156262 RepID=UPI003512CEFB
MTVVLRASSFASGSEAQDYVQRVVNRNRDRIAQWLSGGAGERLVLTADFPGEITGRLLPAATALAGRAPFDVSTVRVVLQRDTAAANGFVVRYAYPTEE